MECLDTRLVSVHCLFYDKSEDRRFYEYSYPIVRNAQAYRKLVESRDITIVVVNLVDLNDQDINALLSSKHVRQDGLTFVAIEGNLSNRISEMLHRRLDFSRVLPTDVSSRKLKYTISYFDNLRNFDTMVADHNKARGRDRSVSRSAGSNRRSEKRSSGIVPSVIAGFAIFISVISIYAKNGAIDDCYNSDDPRCLVSVESRSLVSDTPIVSKAGDEGASVEEKESKIKSKIVSAPSILKANFEDAEILAFTKQIDDEILFSSMELDKFVEMGDNRVESQSRGASPLKNSLVYDQKRVSSSSASGKSKSSIEKNVAKNKLDRVMKLALTQIKKRRYLSSRGDGSINYLKKVDRKTEEGARISYSISKAIVYTLLDDYVQSAQSGNVKRMQGLQRAAAEMNRYVLANNLDIMRSRAFVTRASQFFNKIDSISKDKTGRGYHDAVSGMRQLLLGVIYTKNGTAPIRRTERLIMD